MRDLSDLPKVVLSLQLGQDTNPDLVSWFFCLHSDLVAGISLFVAEEVN